MSKPLPPDHDTTLHVRDHCLCLHTQRAARRLARMFDDALRPVGITNGQFSLMMSLNRPQPARMKEIADFLAMDRTTLTANLKALERRALVAIAVDPDDRRGRLLTLTDDGLATLTEAMPIWRETHGALEAGLDDCDMLRRQLQLLS
ncbi:MarR family winged helix-turn-helix transcriptional regulator [Mesorhizobium xinjiangense]|uniref:MarR family winged helix-turn-helix transcriptional regulator n=1 Tax=Mesorhizobium xinjiangense TaxID=2678685 RepID=UPI0012EE4122|nr:MarR family transcriptional regulator [Mesorhizobium xinjiangense]